MINMRVRGLLLCSLVLSATVVAVLNASNASADQIVTRSLTLLPSSDGKTGGSAPSGGAGYTTGSNPNHKFAFTLPTAGNVGSVKLLYCQTATGTCNAPAGLSLSSATWGSDSGTTVSFTGIGSQSANSAVITRGVAPIAANAAVVMQLNNVVNPSAIGAFYVRITSYASTDASGTAIDAGNVAAATANAIQLSGVMPESLVFCVGMTVDATCTTVTTGVINFGAEFSSTTPAYATSQMAAGTNAGGGYIITVAGETLKSGSATIPAIGATAQIATNGTSKFGLNLAADTAATPVGAGSPASAAIASASNGTTLKGNVLAGYSTGGNAATATYKFEASTPGTPVTSTVADSSNGGIGATNGQVYTVTYMVTVAGLQTAGTYTTTLTYVCTPTF